MTHPEEARGFSTAAIRRAVNVVLDGERVGPAAISITFLSAAKMRALNRRALGRDRATDVIAFSLPHLDRLVGDIYICPAVAQRAVKEGGVPELEELTRLVVHGVLHVVGYDHPNHAARSTSLMWKTQERYVRTVQPQPRQ